MIFFMCFLILNYFVLVKEYVELLKHFYQPLKKFLPTIVIFKDKNESNIEIVLIKFLHSDYFIYGLTIFFFGREINLGDFINIQRPNTIEYNCKRHSKHRLARTTRLLSSKSQISWTFQAFPFCSSRSVNFEFPQEFSYSHKVYCYSSTKVLPTHRDQHQTQLTVSALPSTIFEKRRCYTTHRMECDLQQRPKNPSQGNIYL